MRLLIIRHGKAEEPRGLGLARARDAARRLTAAGRRDTRRAAMGLARIAPAPDVLASSPLPRAFETAEIVAHALRCEPPLALAALAPGGSRSKVCDWLAAQPADATAAIVGHEPDLGRLAGWLLASRASSLIVLKKAGACLIEFDGRARAGTGTLAWLLAPAQLRRLAA
jgi:phosphohistidine phosphatase